MNGWHPSQVSALKKARQQAPAYVTDYQLAGQLSGKLRKSPEAIRWRLREMRREAAPAGPPKILLLDIETMPIEALVFGTWKQNIYMDNIKKDWSVLCWAAKWLFDDTVHGQVVRPEEAVAHEDASVLGKLWEMVNEADIIVHHNGNEFDMKRLNARWFVKGYPKPMYYQPIDTKVAAQATFGFTFNKLDWIAHIIGVGRKVETEFTWWKECEAGNKKYLAQMLEYNKHDVHLEEEVYLRMRPWMDKHPNLNLYTNTVGNVCPACGSNNLDWGGTYATQLGKYQGFRCQDCGAIGRSTKKQYKIQSSEVQN